MKKLWFGLLLLGACSGNARFGTYVAHINGEYAINDDTLIVTKDMVIKRTGYQVIKVGKLLPKAWSVKWWRVDSPDLPPMQFANGKLVLINTVYTKLK